MRNFKLPSKVQINSVFHAFSKKEKIVFIGLMVVLLVSTVSILESINKYFMVAIPLRGGSISIGVVGVPRFINPILANGEADQDLVALIYSGLMRKNGDGTFIPDLAEKYEESKNGLNYTFTLKDKAYFHDGEQVTADDVVFTINSIKNSVIESPYKVSFEGVVVEKIDDKNIKFTLKQPYASFLENTTIGILPAHLWNNTPLELNTANTNPIGSGPYEIDAINKQSSGSIDSISLIPFNKFVLGKPLIQNLNLNFYQNEDDLVKALSNNQVDQIGSISALNAENLKERNYKIESVVLPRVFGLFFNQNQNQIFTDKVVVNSINQLIDKDKIVRDVLFGYGVVLDSPIPPNMTEYHQNDAQNTFRDEATQQNIVTKIQSDLAKDGWKPGEDGFLEKIVTIKKKKTTTPLAFSISTRNITELTKTAELIKQDLSAAGIKVEIKTFETGNLNQTVIRPRKYDALLFGEIINHESDLLAFWHSTQRKDPGLNVAMYTSAKVDQLLEDASISLDDKTRIDKYTQFANEVKKDMSAVFLYSPDFIYVIPKNLKDYEVHEIISPSDRFLNAYKWYTETENVWKTFAK